MEAHIRPKQVKSLPQGGEIQYGDTRNHQDIPPTRGVGHLNRFQGRLLPYTNTGTIQEISEISCPRSDIPVQGPALWSVDSTLGVHCGSKGSEINGHAQGYKDPPVPRRLVGENQVPPSLFPAYPGPGENVSRPRLVNLEKSELEPKQVFDFVGYTDHTRPVADPASKNTDTSIPAGQSNPTIHVLDSLLTATKKQVHLGRLHMRPIQWHLKNN